MELLIVMGTYAAAVFVLRVIRGLVDWAQYCSWAAFKRLQDSDWFIPVKRLGTYDGIRIDD